MIGNVLVHCCDRLHDQTTERRMSETPAPTNPDTSLGTAFWREHPHLFVPAGWGPEYCRCCLDEDGGAIHDVFTDPATHVGNCTDYPVSRPSQIIFAVSGWDDRGACSYHAQDTYEDALAFVDKLKTGFDRGRVYDHYQIDERRYRTVCDTNVVVLS